MNRQIKFRAKRIDNGEWVYGGCVINQKFNQPFIVEISETGYMNFVEVIPETVGQLSPLKDDNGNDIYEGDVIHTSGQNEYYIQVVEFHNTSETSGRGWIGRNIFISDRFKNKVEPIERFSYFSMPHGLIIGNIHEPQTKQ